MLFVVWFLCVFVFGFFFVEFFEWLNIDFETNFIWTQLELR